MYVFSPIEEEGETEGSEIGDRISEHSGDQHENDDPDKEVYRARERSDSTNSGMKYMYKLNI